MPRIALLQLKAFDDPAVNIDTIKKAISRAADGGAQIICTQELFATKYFCAHQSAAAFAHAQSIPGDLTNELSDLAAELGVVIVASVFEMRTKGVYHNTAVVFDTDGRLLGKYRQQHIAQDDHSEQKYYFTQGEDGYQVFQTKLGNLGVLISWDQWFPEAARINALMGADMIIIPSSMGCPLEEIRELGDTMHDRWQSVLRSHAITNCCYIAAINRVGAEDSIGYWGQSFICDSHGTIIAQGTDSDDSIVYADLDLESISQQRCSYPFFRDRRIDTYKKVTQRVIDNNDENKNLGNLTD